MQRDVMEYDVVVVGGGPAGLAAAIRHKELKPDASICVLEKASAIGAQLISGCALEPGPLDALVPGWRETPPDICVPATRDEFWYLTRTGGMRLPTPRRPTPRRSSRISTSTIRACPVSCAMSLRPTSGAGASSEASYGPNALAAATSI